MLIGHVYVFFGDMSVQVFYSFFNQMYCCSSSLYTSEYQSLIRYMFWNILYHSIGCLFILLPQWPVDVTPRLREKVNMQLDRMFACVLSRVWLLWPRGLYPARLLCPLSFPGKSTGMGCHFLLVGDFLTQRLNPHLLRLSRCRWILYCWDTWGAIGKSI